MSLVKKLLASVGIGSARVDTLVERTQLYPGEELRGVVQMRGGDAPQEFNSVVLALCTSYLRESGDHRVNTDFILAEATAHQPFTLQPQEQQELPFSLRVPDDCPISLHKSKVWLQTRLDISMAIDPRDSDALVILPTTAMAVVLEAMDRLGFYLREVQCEQARRYSAGRPFVQDFEFVPRSGPFTGRFDEIELYFSPAGGGLDIILELDRRARGLSGLLSEALGADERHSGMSLSQGEIARGSSYVASLLERAIDQRG